MPTDTDVTRSYCCNGCMLLRLRWMKTFMDIHTAGICYHLKVSLVGGWCCPVQNAYEFLFQTSCGVKISTLDDISILDQVLDSK
jgi:hypothetical protein